MVHKWQKLAGSTPQPQGKVEKDVYLLVEANYEITSASSCGFAERTQRFFDKLTVERAPQPAPLLFR